MNFKGAALDTTHTGASLSAVRADLVLENIQNRLLTTAWSAPPLRLANNTYCDPLGTTWLTTGFMGKCVYQWFVVIPDLSSSFALGMYSMIRASLTIYIPTRTVIMDDNPPFLDDLNDIHFDPANLEGRTMMFLDVSPSALSDKVEEASLVGEEKTELLKLLEKYNDLCHGHLGRTSMAEHVVNTGDAKSVNLPSYCTSPV